jgi:hypothetical protein
LSLAEWLEEERTAALKGASTKTIAFQVFKKGLHRLRKNPGFLFSGSPASRPLTVLG